jgi:hypothetical protein
MHDDRRMPILEMHLGNAERGAVCGDVEAKAFIGIVPVEDTEGGAEVVPDLLDQLIGEWPLRVLGRGSPPDMLDELHGDIGHLPFRDRGPPRMDQKEVAVADVDAVALGSKARCPARRGGGDFWRLSSTKSSNTGLSARTFTSRGSMAGPVSGARFWDPRLPSARSLRAFVRRPWRAALTTTL